VSLSADCAFPVGLSSKRVGPSPAVSNKRPLVSDSDPDLPSFSTWGRIEQKLSEDTIHKQSAKSGLSLMALMNTG